MMQLINWDIISHPYNWATILIMALFGLMLLALVSPEPSMENS